MTTPTTTLASRIAAASKEVGGKLKADKRNAQQSYDYVSADKILAVCGQALAEQGIVLFPSVTDHATHKEEGGKRYDARVSFVFTLSDGATQFELPWVGYGSDYSVPDKAIYKAITSGHKYFLAKLLNIGEGNEDGEHAAPAEPEPRKVQPATQAMLDTLHKHGSDLYGDEWDERRHELAEWASAGATRSSKELSGPEVQKLIDGIKKKIAVRNAAPEPSPVGAQ